MVFDISEPTNPVLLGTFDPLSHPYDIVTRDTLAFTNATNTFRILSVADPTNIYEISNCDPLGYPIRIELKNDHAIVGCWEDLITIDIADPAAPASADYLSSYGLTLFCDMDLVGDRVYLGARDTDLIVVDLPSVYSPTVVDQYGDPSQIFTRSCVQARGDYAYIIDSGYVGVLDAHAGTPVSLIDQHYLPGKIFEAEVVGDYAYV